MTWNDRADFDQSRADHEYEIEMLEPLDDTHAACVEARYCVRRDFAAARRRIAKWEPAPCPMMIVDRTRVPYLDQIERPRGWFRA